MSGVSGCWNLHPPADVTWDDQLRSVVAGLARQANEYKPARLEWRFEATARDGGPWRPLSEATFEVLWASRERMLWFCERNAIAAIGELDENSP